MDSSSPTHDNRDRGTDENDDLPEAEEFLTPDSTRRGKRKQKPSSRAAEADADVDGSENEEGTEQDNAKVKKILPTRSEVWNHFTRWPLNRNKCDCNYCKRTLSCPTTSGTTTLWSHLDICKSYGAFKDGQDPSQGQTVINRDGHLQTAKVTEVIFRAAVHQMVVIGELPLAFVESVAFRHFCDKVNLYRPPSRRTLSKDIVKMYVERKAAMREWFITSKQRVSITTDIWVCQVTGASYMVITAHYIDKSWRLKKLIIGFKSVIDHKGKTISKTLLYCLAEWGIERVFCVTVDNASANTNALGQFQSNFSIISDDSLVMNGDFMHMRCAGHIINLIVKEGMSDYADSVTAVRNAISYVRSGTTRQKSFELRVDTGRMTRGSLPLDVKTRWNSTYLMLQRALKFKGAFDRMEIEDMPYNDHFLEVENGKKGLDHQQAINGGKLRVNISEKLQLLCATSDNDLKIKAEEMFKKFDKYWDGLKNINKMLVIVSVFYPRKKMQFASMCFDDLYGEGSKTARVMQESVSSIMRDMYEEYSQRYKCVHQQSDVTNQSASQCTQEQPMGCSWSDSADDEFFGYHPVESRYNNLLNKIGVRDTDELDTYLRDKVENPQVMMGLEFDVLSWWKVNSGKYPILSEMARDLFAMQVSSVASESAFSTSGRVINSYRSCLTSYMVEVLMCSEQWLKQDIDCELKVLTNQQILAEVEFEDGLEKEFNFGNQFSTPT
ncbi:Zinc finger BED-type [Arabidopsis thaliana x Arabidopsis arenosa]|nr:Zinc finger BED-type [Arabidopsis thaliana x Arabidopsis arenosa]